MNERMDDNGTHVDEREMPRENEAREMRKQDEAGNSLMSTADLAYGRDGGKGTSLKATTSAEDRMTLIDERDAGGYRERWTSVQTHFIDEPRETVSDADELVADVIQSLARRFAEERQSLEQQWQSGSEVSTEDLRQAMQHYRSFFERLLAA
jgi:hypothetical protein